MAGFNVYWDGDLLDDLPKLHQLGGPRRRMRLQPATFGPPVGVVVAAHVAEDYVLPRPVQNDAQVQIHAGRPEVGVHRAGDPVQA